MSNLETNLYRASSICEGNFTYLKDYSKTYTFTTENINGYIKYFDLKRKRLLTVGSSGDQVLNAFFYGARDITLYDINPYAKYYVYLKIATILSIEYMEFQEFFFKREIHNLKDYYNRKMFCKDLYDKIKYNLRSFDYESFLYFDELFHSFEPTTIREYLFDDDECRNKVIKNFNVYLTNEISYNKLKKTIKNINFKYICGNIFEDKIPGKFDNIILSNLCTITNLKTFKNLLKKLDFNNLKENGSILLGYLWDTDFYSNDFYEDWKEIYKLPLTKEILKDFITEHHQINSSRDYLWNENKKNDLVLIYRKTK